MGSGSADSGERACPSPVGTIAPTPSISAPQFRSHLHFGLGYEQAMGPLRQKAKVCQVRHGKGTNLSIEVCWFAHGNDGERLSCLLLPVGPEMPCPGHGRRSRPRDKEPCLHPEFRSLGKGWLV